LDFPSSIQFPNAPVKHTSTKNLYVQNLGECETSFVLKTKEPFQVFPNEGTLGAKKGIQITISFTPNKLKQYNATLDILYGDDHGDDGERRVNSCVLEGVGVDVHVKLDKDIVKLPPTFITQIAQQQVKLINKSDIKVHYEWKNYSSVKDEKLQKKLKINQLSQFVEEGSREYKKLKRDVESEVFLFKDDVFNINPISGDVWPHSELIMDVEFNPKEATTYKRTAFLEVSGREIRLPLQLCGTGKGPEVSFSYNSLEIGEIFINSLHEFEVLKVNKVNQID
jgi:hydrocephalus-inducing protein